MRFFSGGSREGFWITVRNIWNGNEYVQASGLWTHKTDCCEILTVWTKIIVIYTLFRCSDMKLLLSPSCRPPSVFGPVQVCWTHLSRIMTLLVLVCCVALAVSVPWVSALSSSEARGKDKQEDPFNYTLSIYAHPGFSSGTGAKQSMMAGWRSRVSYICINSSVYTVRIL